MVNSLASEAALPPTVVVVMAVDEDGLVSDISIIVALSLEVILLITIIMMLLHTFLDLDLAGVIVNA